MTLSVIIPTLNEAAVIDSTLRTLRRSDLVHEVIVVDGGSSDATTEIAARHATVHHGSRGRARQMNAGAEVATGSAYLFLHADTLCPPSAITAAVSALERGATSGTFQLQFDMPSPMLRFYAACTRIPWIRICFGDRGLFCTRDAFEQVAGFPDWLIFEDLELARRLHEAGSFHFLDEVVTTSARRFRSTGIVRQQMLNLRLWLQYITGTHPDTLADLYEYPSPSEHVE
ncbi:TIGR04283 family arsenosugar biosynthesis glycosyltransferase [Longibacter salinarum]|uniref:TIGR04283 family arsenosugar biosynthesis glycosyltransferase n=1 Tax=Longibacter salinarum TaxID=1850348 RepID=UPI001FEA0AC2|nr:TIGR04283 family arsenosugar biosynthesis glycosyltransferase [Longibacter salinarum]